MFYRAQRFLKDTLSPMWFTVTGSFLKAVEMPVASVTVDVCPERLWLIKLWWLHWACSQQPNQALLGILHHRADLVARFVCFPLASINILCVFASGRKGGREGERDHETAKKLNIYTLFSKWSQVRRHNCMSLLLWYLSLESLTMSHSASTVKSISQVTTAVTRWICDLFKKTFSKINGRL